MQLAVVILHEHATLLVEFAYGRRRNAFIDYVITRHFAESGLKDFAAVWKVSLSQNTEDCLTSLGVEG